MDDQPRGAGDGVILFGHSRVEAEAAARLVRDLGCDLPIQVWTDRRIGSRPSDLVFVEVPTGSAPAYAVAGTNFDRAVVLRRDVVPFRPPCRFLTALRTGEPSLWSSDGAVVIVDRIRAAPLETLRSTAAIQERRLAGGVVVSVRGRPSASIPDAALVGCDLPGVARYVELLHAFTSQP